MADNSLHIELVSADRVVWSGEGTEVIARTVEGDVGILVDHAPVLSLLAPGAVTIKAVDAQTVTAVVADGFLSVADNRVSILSESALLTSEIDEQEARDDLAAAQTDDDEVAVRFAELRLSLIGKA